MLKITNVFYNRGLYAMTAVMQLEETTVIYEIAQEYNSSTERLDTIVKTYSGKPVPKDIEERLINKFNKVIEVF